MQQGTIQRSRDGNTRHRSLSRPIHTVGSRRPYLPVDDAQLLCRQVVEGEQEAVVEVALPAQRAVVDVRLLLVVFMAVEPSEGQGDKETRGQGDAGVYFLYVCVRRRIR